MRVDFYQLGAEPAEHVVPLLARAAKGQGERLLVVSADEAQIDRIDRSLWERFPQDFLAHGRSGSQHEARQPVLLSASSEVGNGARFLVLADGRWREEAGGFERVFLLFGEAELQGARACWRMLDGGKAERRYWKLTAGKWTEGP